MTHEFATIKNVQEDVMQIILNLKKIRIKISDLPDLLGKKVFSDEKVFKRPRVGVITGLAYTSLGGTTLHIEAAAVATGAPGFKQTGQLGQVMVESSEIAYSYVRSLFKKRKDVLEFFRKNFIHLHVPAGATPKDGPSAGITMACALYSLAVGQPIVPDTARTGELTLNGMVMPIGGVKEKIIAAKRAKVQHVILPEDNREDFDMLPEQVKEGITPYFVRTFQDVLKICFP